MKGSSPNSSHVDSVRSNSLAANTHNGFRSKVLPTDADFTGKLCEISTEKLITLSQLAEKIGVPLFAVRRAANKGDFPVYRVGNGRARVRLTEVIAAVLAAESLPK